MDSLPLRRQQEESDQKQRQQAAKAPKLLDEQQQPPASALALFVHEPYGGSGSGSSSGNRLAATATASPSAGGSIFPTIPSSAPAACPRPGSYFSLSQWRELELQALIYKYIVAGASVPLELILHIRRSLLNATAHYSSHYQSYPHLQLAMMPTGYWGSSTSDPEPGRCRRTDGKKWRCSREVVAGHKYCERHMHRGRNRSRKHVEVPTPTTGGVSDMMKASSRPSSSLGPGEQRQGSSLLAGAGLTPPLDGLPLTRRHAGDNKIEGSLPQSYYRSFAAAEQNGGSYRSGSQILRHFFNDWPSEEQHEPDATHGSSVGPLAPAAKLSISIPEQPPKSDFSLKLSTGNSEKRGACAEGATRDIAVAKQIRASSWSGWVGQNATAVGGPLAEALRLSSSSSPSPTSVLQKPNAAVSETTSSVST